MEITPLGQSGFLLELGSLRILIDPYLSNSVAEQFGPAFERQCPSVLSDSALGAIDWVFLTHAHLDHADPESLRRIYGHSPGVRFLVPYACRVLLHELGIAAAQVVLPPEHAWMSVGEGMQVRAVPAAHLSIVRNAEGELRDVGYLLRVGTRVFYHAGDTIPDPALYDALAGVPIDYAFLPINERNYYRAQADIVGNMSVREAFRFADDLGVRVLVPIHWDLFPCNSVYPEEVQLLYQLERPRFELQMMSIGQKVRVV